MDDGKFYFMFQAGAPDCSVHRFGDTGGVLHTVAGRLKQQAQISCAEWAECFISPLQHTSFSRVCQPSSFGVVCGTDAVFRGVRAEEASTCGGDARLSVMLQLYQTGTSNQGDATRQFGRLIRAAHICREREGEIQRTHRRTP